MFGVVIVAFHSEHLTLSFVREQLPRLDVPWCAIVVNEEADESTTQTLAQACGASMFKDGLQLGNHDIVFLNVEENLGYACGNNYGAFKLNALCSDISEFLFTNTDIVIPEGKNISLLLEKKNSMPYCGAIGPRIVNDESVEQGPFFTYPFIWRKTASKLCPFFRRITAKMKSSSYTTAQEGECLFLQGSFFIVDKDIFMRVKGFDERTFLYGEELLLACRMQEYGFKEYYYPAFTVVHQEGGSTKGTVLYDIRDKLATASHRVYFEHYAHVSQFALLCYDVAQWIYEHVFNRILHL